ncbi:large ribosomal subunit protein mL42-like [Haliotis asinina]|uniref:large ribosomal subunit protein mL42-like n=1 Tax=Haliotis asinina TaxID=109174 RepID=UPI003531A79A
MAAPMRSVFCQLLVRKCTNATPACMTYRRAVSTSKLCCNQNNDDRNPQVCLSPDGSTVLCWHPAVEFPYQHTKPIPRKIEELAEGESVLKVQYLVSEKLKHREDGPTDKELANIFFTSKHRWYSQPQKKYRKVRTPKDRDRI